MRARALLTGLRRTRDGRGDGAERNPSTSADVVVLAALPEEGDAMARALGMTREQMADGVRFREGSTAGRRTRVVTIGTMGGASAAQAAQRVIERWKPPRILLVGIVAGVRGGDLRFGDVLVADQVVGYGLGRRTPEAMERRWDVYRADSYLLHAARALRPEDWMPRITARRPGDPWGRTNPAAAARSTRLHPRPCRAGGAAWWVSGWRRRARGAP